MAQKDREAFVRLLRLAMTCTTGEEMLFIHPWDVALVHKYGHDCFEPCTDEVMIRQHNLLGFLHEPHRVGLAALYYNQGVVQGTAVTLRVTQGAASQPGTLRPIPWLQEPLANRTEHFLYELDSSEEAPPRTAWDRIRDGD
jgi:hypothetical protein